MKYRRQNTILNDTEFGDRCVEERKSKKSNLRNDRGMEACMLLNFPIPQENR
jgi:hypothetical protein